MNDATAGTNPNQTFPVSLEPGSGPRLDNASKAQQIFWMMYQANKGRNAYGAFLQGLADGNPPYKQSTLRNTAQGWRANFSLNEAKSMKDTAKTPYYDLFGSGPTYCEVRTRIDGDLTADDASGVITEEFHRMLSGWSGFALNFWQMLDDFVGFGRGWLYWPTDSWMFKRTAWWKVRFPDGTGVDAEDWSLFSIENNFDPVTLNSYIKDESVARAAGWNPDRVRKAIMKSCPVDPNAADNVMEFQKMIRDQDISLSYKANTVQAASVYVKEWDGSWSLMIVETGMELNGEAALGKGDWLFYKRNIADDVRKVLATFMFEVENGSVNGLGGLLRDIADQVKTKNRLMCSVVDNAFMRGTIIMQAQTSSSRVKGGLVTVGGGVTLVPEGLAIQNSTIMGDIEGGLVINDAIGREVERNTGVFRTQQEKPKGNPEPLGATQLRFAQSTVLTNSAVDRFQTQLDWMFAEVYRRASLDQVGTSKAVKMAKEFQKACKDRGVTNEQLKKVDYVRAVRVVGNGSPAMRQQLTAEIAQFLPVLGLGQRGLKNFSRMVIAARGGQELVNRLIPAADEADLPSEQDREALQENTSIKVGNPAIVIENDDHVIHLKQHFGAAFAGLQAVQQGGQPAEAASFIQGVLPHIEEHIQMMRNPNEQKQAIQTFKQLQQAFGQLMAAIKQNQPDPQAQQQVMSDIQLRQLETQAKIADRNTKTQAAIKDKAIRTQQSLAIEQARASQQIGLADASTASQIQRESSKALASTAIKAASKQT